MPSSPSPPTIIPPTDPSNPLPRILLGGLCQRRVCLLPTWRGWILILLVVSLLLTVASRRLCAFLTVNKPVPGGVLVIEGWVPPYVARLAIEEFHRHSYAGVYVTGQPMTEGDAYFPEYDNMANLTAAKVVKMGLPSGSVHAVPAPAVGRDRTYTMAVALKQRLEADRVSTAQLNVFSLGPHARRSRLLYEHAFGPHSRIGMVGVTASDFDPDRWWTTSYGFRMVVDEFIAYLYARFLFYPGG